MYNLRLMIPRFFFNLYTCTIYIIHRCFVHFPFVDVYSCPSRVSACVSLCDLGFELLKFSVGWAIFSLWVFTYFICNICAYILGNSFATVQCIWYIRTLQVVNVWPFNDVGILWYITGLCVYILCLSWSNSVVWFRDAYLLKEQGITKKLEIIRCDRGPNLFIHLISQEWGKKDRLLIDWLIDW